MKKQKFAIVDNTTYEGKDALDFYSKALLEGGSTSQFRLVPNVKSKIKLPRYDMGNLIKDAGCSWDPSGEGTLAQKEFEVCSKDIQLELCATTFENNFLGELLRPGHNTGEVTPDDFLAYMTGQAAMKVRNDLEIAAWQGDSASVTYPLSICDGLNKKMAADADVLDINGVAAITTANVVEEIQKVYAMIPATIINSPDLRIFVSDHIFRTYQQAIAEASNEAYYVGAKEPNFLGIPLVLAQGQLPHQMAAGETTNFVLLTDLLSDEEELNIIPQNNVTGTRTVRIAGGFKIGFDYLVSEEVVYYYDQT